MRGRKRQSGLRPGGNHLVGRRERAGREPCPTARPRWKPGGFRSFGWAVVVGAHSGRLGLAALLLLSVVSLPAAMSDSELRTVFSEANGLFREANEVAAQNPIAAEDLYRRAALRFERLVDEGAVRNGKLYYNLGNAYFRANDIGRALLNYRRAEQGSPHDLNLQQNLSAARASRLDTFEPTEQDRVLRTLLFWHYDFSTRVRTAIFALAALICWVLAGWRLFRPEATPRGVLIGSAVTAVLFLGSLLVDAYRQSEQSPGVILAHEVVARKGNGESYEPSFKEPLHAGTEFLVLDERGAWRHIELPDSRRCWVPVGAGELVNR